MPKWALPTCRRELGLERAGLPPHLSFCEQLRDAKRYSTLALFWQHSRYRCCPSHQKVHAAIVMFINCSSYQRGQFYYKVGRQVSMSFCPLQRWPQGSTCGFTPVYLFTRNQYEAMYTFHSEQLSGCKAFSRAGKMMGRGEGNSLWIMELVKCQKNWSVK